MNEDWLARFDDSFRIQSDTGRRQRQQSPDRRWFFRLLCCVAWLVAAGGNAARASLIEITNVPPFGSFSDLGGDVLLTNAATYRVAVFIYIPGAGWWSKPFCDPQLTVIQPNGSWTADITTGGSDQKATRITALLVSSNYNEHCVTGAASLPTNVTAQAIDSVTVFRRDPSVRWIQFSGYDWWVKASSDPVGPGPNYFSSSTNNVWIDEQSQLHVRITNRSNQWQCAEVVSERSFGYGAYRFELNSNVDDIDLNAVLGLFTWSDDPAYAHREIDIEGSRWGNAADSNNAQFVVQPFDTAGHLARYDVPSNQTNSTHWFVWETNQVSFQSQRGSFKPGANPDNLITNWVYTLTVPQSGDENVRINFWLVNGAAPVGNHELEFVIKSFQFVPPGDPKPSLLSEVALQPGGQVKFVIEGEVDRRYEIQNSDNLQDWQTLSTLLATNRVMPFVDTGPGAIGTRFFRVVTLP